MWQAHAWDPTPWPTLTGRWLSLRWRSSIALLAPLSSDRNPPQSWQSHVWGSYGIDKLMAPRCLSDLGRRVARLRLSTEVRPDSSAHFVAHDSHAIIVRNDHIDIVLPSTTRGRVSDPLPSGTHPSQAYAFSVLIRRTAASSRDRTCNSIVCFVAHPKTSICWGTPSKTYFRILGVKVSRFTATLSARRLLRKIT
jgi:hypothetical protein